MLKKTLIAAVLTAGALSVIAAQAEETGKEINFGIISTESTSNLKATWQPFLAAMEKGTG
ncbi:MAG: phosphonate ABC transporter substrate-binding protein, partial [Pseudomonadota bacterium]